MAIWHPSEALQKQLSWVARLFAQCRQVEAEVNAFVADMNGDGEFTEEKGAAMYERRNRIMAELDLLDEKVRE